ncbi:response regulator [Cohnella caldifontis]|uniref:response regulator n=1 Tax=Cohnella caldifontis TaxID=3027471 RepID=UPI0023EDB767|nr:response regulator [Cohnella sp. YIM B05605]
MLVDDEALALRYLELQLNRIGGLEIVGKFQLPEEALEAAPRLQPDVVFLDIDMPELGGLEAAERLQELHPPVEIVFVTAYDKFAVQAFELQALDYVLKPLQTDRLETTVRRILGQRGRADRHAASPIRTAAVRCFQSMQIDPGTGEPLPWRTAKAQELFAYLVYRRNQRVRKDALMDLLWPEMEESKAQPLLYTTIYRLRKMLDNAGLSIKILKSSSGYGLDLGDCPLDVEQWEKALSEADGLSLETADGYARLLEAYAGDYLAEHDYAWAEQERQRLQNMWYHHATALGRLWEDHGRLSEALDWYLRIQQKYPYGEDVYFALMRVYGEMGQIHFVEQQYAKLTSMLDKEYGVSPSERTAEWYRNWRAATN